MNNCTHLSDFWKKTCGLIVLCSALSLVGCAELESWNETRTVELGTGTWRFEPLQDGEEIALVRGAQGGWHVWISLNTTGLGEDAELIIETGLADEENWPAQTVTTRAFFDPEREDGSRNYLGWAAVLAEPGCYVGELLRVRVRVIAGDEVLSAEREWRVLPGEDPPLACAGTL